MFEPFHDLHLGVSNLTKKWFVSHDRSAPFFNKEVGSVRDGKAFVIFKGTMPLRVKGFQYFGRMSTFREVKGHCSRMDRSTELLCAIPWRGRLLEY